MSVIERPIAAALLPDRVAPTSPDPTREEVIARYGSERIAGYAQTPEEYITFERASDVKHEYWEGWMISVAGASYEHNEISSNLLYLFKRDRRTTGAQYRALGGDMKVIIRRRRYLYPDVCVVLGEPSITPDDGLQNPVAVFEILSSTTEADDRGKKFAEYQQIASLRHYVLVEQSRVGIAHYEKQDGGDWTLAGEYTRLSDTVVLTLGTDASGTPVAVTLALADVYYDVTFADSAGTSVPT